MKTSLGCGLSSSANRTSDENSGRGSTPCQSHNIVSRGSRPCTALAHPGSVPEYTCADKIFGTGRGGAAFRPSRTFPLACDANLAGTRPFAQETIPRAASPCPSVASMVWTPRPSRRRCGRPADKTARLSRPKGQHDRMPLLVARPQALVASKSRLRFQPAESFPE